jgi:predicted SprT family Zn-dependent metalloprotease
MDSVEPTGAAKFAKFTSVRRGRSVDHGSHQVQIGRFKSRLQPASVVSIPCAFGTRLQQHGRSHLRTDRVSFNPVRFRDSVATSCAITARSTNGGMVSIPCAFGTRLQRTTDRFESTSLVSIPCAFGTRLQHELGESHCIVVGLRFNPVRFRDSVATVVGNRHEFVGVSIPCAFGTRLQRIPVTLGQRWFCVSIPCAFGTRLQHATVTYKNKANISRFNPVRFRDSVATNGIGLWMHTGSFPFVSIPCAFGTRLQPWLLQTQTAQGFAKHFCPNLVVFDFRAGKNSAVLEKNRRNSQEHRDLWICPLWRTTRATPKSLLRRHFGLHLTLVRIVKEHAVFFESSP